MSSAELELPEGVEPEETLFEASYSAGDAEERRFDEIISALEDAVMAPAFRDPIVAFCREHCKAFVPGVEENTMEQHALFARYEELTETRVERELSARIPGFEMGAFEAMLAQPGRAEAISGDVLDLLMAFGDFDEFKSSECTRRLQEWAALRSPSTRPDHAWTLACTSAMLSYREQVEYEEAGSAPGSSTSAGGASSAGGGAASAATRWDTGVPGESANSILGALGGARVR